MLVFIVTFSCITFLFSFPSWCFSSLKPTLYLRFAFKAPTDFGTSCAFRLCLLWCRRSAAVPLGYKPWWSKISFLILAPRCILKNYVVIKIRRCIRLFCFWYRQVYTEDTVSIIEILVSCGDYWTVCLLFLLSCKYGY